MAAPATPIVAHNRVQNAGISCGANTVTVTLTCTTVPAARQLFGELRRGIEAGEIVLQLGGTEVGR